MAESPLDVERAPLDGSDMDPTPETSDIAQTELTHSRMVHRRTGRTFYLATRLLPNRIRDSTHVLYAFFRMADQVVDTPDPDSPAIQRERLNAMREKIHGTRETGDPILLGMRSVRTSDEIPAGEIDAFIDAMINDIEFSGVSTYEDLEEYMRGSAVAVAYMMLSVMGSDDRERARPHARALGEAFQLTNFIRDVREDIEELDRIYLPTTTLDKFGVDTADIETGRVTTGFKRAIHFEMRRAEDRYRRGVAGISFLPSDCQLGVLMAACLYAEHHRAIRRLGFDVRSTTPTLGVREYIPVLLRTWIYWRLLGDPEAVFYRVSPINRTDRPEINASEMVQTTAGWRNPIRHIRQRLDTLHPYFGHE